jgi:hypothetical protein
MVTKSTKRADLNEINRTDRLNNLERQMETLIGLMAAGNTAQTPPAVQVPDAVFQRQIDDAKSVRGYTANGARILAPVAAKAKTPFKVAPVQPELKLIGVEMVEDQNKYPGAVMLKFNNDKRGRFIYGEEWQAVIAAIKAGRI